MGMKIKRCDGDENKKSMGISNLVQQCSMCLDLMASLSLSGLNQECDRPCHVNGPEPLHATAVPNSNVYCGRGSCNRAICRISVRSSWLFITSI